MNIDFEITKRSKDTHPESHIHEDYEILIPFSDNGKFFIREREYDFKMGTVFILPPFEIHRCFSHSIQDYDRYIIHFSKDILNMLSTSKTDMSKVFDNAESAQFFDDFTIANIMSKLTLLSAPAKEEFASDTERNLQFCSFITDIAKLISVNGENYSRDTKQQDNRINEILKYIHENYSKDISLEDISNNFYMSKSRLSQIFKESTGFSVGDYLITYRIKRACTMLQEGHSIKHISINAGFKTESNFIRTFKKRMGISPGKFLK